MNNLEGSHITSQNQATQATQANQAEQPAQPTQPAQATQATQAAQPAQPSLVTRYRVAKSNIKTSENNFFDLNKIYDTQLQRHLSDEERRHKWTASFLSATNRRDPWQFESSEFENPFCAITFENNFELSFLAKLFDCVVFGEDINTAYFSLKLLKFSEFKRFQLLEYDQYAKILSSDFEKIKPKLQEIKDKWTDWPDLDRRDIFKIHCKPIATKIEPAFMIFVNQNVLQYCDDHDLTRYSAKRFQNGFNIKKTWKLDVYNKTRRRNNIDPSYTSFARMNFASQAEARNSQLAMNFSNAIYSEDFKTIYVPIQDLPYSRCPEILRPESQRIWSWFFCLPSETEIANKYLLNENLMRTMVPLEYTNKFDPQCQTKPTNFTLGQTKIVSYIEFVDTHQNTFLQNESFFLEDYNWKKIRLSKVSKLQYDSWPDMYKYYYYLNVQKYGKRFQIESYLSHFPEAVHTKLEDHFIWCHINDNTHDVLNVLLRKYQLNQHSELLPSLHPTQTLQPSTSSQILQPSQPSISLQPLQPLQPSQPSQPSTSLQPSRSSQISQTLQSSTSLQPSRPSQISRPSQPSQISRPSQPSQISQPPQPSQHSQLSATNSSSKSQAQTWIDFTQSPIRKTFYVDMTKEDDNDDLSSTLLEPSHVSQSNEALSSKSVNASQTKDHSKQTSSLISEKSSSDTRKLPSVENALNYLEKVKNYHPGKYNEFLEIMKNFKADKFDTMQVIEQVKCLFLSDNRDLFIEFKQFLPESYRIVIDSHIQKQQQPVSDEKQTSNNINTSVVQAQIQTQAQAQAQTQTQTQSQTRALQISQSLMPNQIQDWTLQFVTKQQISPDMWTSQEMLQECIIFTTKNRNTILNKFLVHELITLLWFSEKSFYFNDSSKANGLLTKLNGKNLTPGWLDETGIKNLMKYNTLILLNTDAKYGDNTIYTLLPISKQARDPEIFNKYGYLIMQQLPAIDETDKNQGFDNSCLTNFAQITYEDVQQKDSILAKSSKLYNHNTLYEDILYAWSVNDYATFDSFKDIREYWSPYSNYAETKSVDLYHKTLEKSHWQNTNHKVVLIAGNVDSLFQICTITAVEGTNSKSGAPIEIDLWISFRPLKLNSTYEDSLNKLKSVERIPEYNSKSLSSINFLLDQVQRNTFVQETGLHEGYLNILQNHPVVGQTVSTKEMSNKTEIELQNTELRCLQDHITDTVSIILKQCSNKSNASAKIKSKYLNLKSNEHVKLNNILFSGVSLGSGCATVSAYLLHDYLLSNFDDNKPNIGVFQLFGTKDGTLQAARSIQQKLSFCVQTDIKNDPYTTVPCDILIKTGSIKATFDAHTQIASPSLCKNYIDSPVFKTNHIRAMNEALDSLKDIVFSNVNKPHNNIHAHLTKDSKRKNRKRKHQNV